MIGWGLRREAVAQLEFKGVQQRERLWRIVDSQGGSGEPGARIRRE